MAYVVARPKGRFEIRESVHTPKGPRARSLANFAHLTDAVLATAGDRATRPFDADAIRRAAARAGATTTRPDMRRFVASSRRMADSLEPRPASPRTDPGDALIDLLGLVAQIAPFQPARTTGPLRYPPLARLRATRGTPMSHR
jgi:hypothetical protein